jgi:hypothetical protein
VKFVRNFFGVKDIKKARQRLDRLIQEEVVANTAHILEVVVKNGAGMHSACNLPSFEHPLLDAKPSTDHISKVPGTFCCGQRASSVIELALDRMTSDMNKSKRPLSYNVRIAVRKC